MKGMSLEEQDKEALGFDTCYWKRGQWFRVISAVTGKAGWWALTNL